MVKVGDTHHWKRSVSEEDVLRFAELSQDKGAHHMQRDEKGRLMAHGLLTATMPTKVGGDLNFIARNMHFDFERAAYSGDTLTCEGRVEAVIEQSSRYKVRFSFVVTNQDGEVVMTGTSSGMIKKG